MEAVSLKVSWEDDLLLSEDESKENVVPLAGDLSMESPRLPLQAAENKPKLKSVVVRPKTVELDSDCDEGKSMCVFRRTSVLVLRLVYTGIGLRSTNH